MDSKGIENSRNYEEKTEEMQSLVSSVPQLIVTPVKNSTNDLISLAEPIRPRRSFGSHSESMMSRRPSAIVSAMRRERQGSSAGNIFLEYVKQ